MSFVDPASDRYSASVPVIIDVISYNIGPHYMPTWWNVGWWPGDIRNHGIIRYWTWLPSKKKICVCSLLMFFCFLFYLIFLHRKYNNNRNEALPHITHYIFKHLKHTAVIIFVVTKSLSILFPTWYSCFKTLLDVQQPTKSCMAFNATCNINLRKTPIYKIQQNV